MKEERSRCGEAMNAADLVGDEAAQVDGLRDAAVRFIEHHLPRNT